MTKLKEIINKGVNFTVVEKLCGNNPRSSSLFYSAFGDWMDYTAFNLIDNSECYFKRAKKYVKQLGFSYEEFKWAVHYKGDINLVKNPLSEHKINADVIVYWGGAMKCLRKFSGHNERKYRSIVKQEYKRGGKDDEVHMRIRQRMKDEIPTRDGFLLSDYELEKIIEDDLFCLKSGGVMVTNTNKDYDRVKSIMNKHGLDPEFYKLDKELGAKLYERKITVWR